MVCCIKTLLSQHFSVQLNLFMFLWSKISLVQNFTLKQDWDLCPCSLSCPSTSFRRNDATCNSSFFSIATCLNNVLNVWFYVHDCSQSEQNLTSNISSQELNSNQMIPLKNHSRFLWYCRRYFLFGPDAFLVATWNIQIISSYITTHQLILWWCEK